MKQAVSSFEPGVVARWLCGGLLMVFAISAGAEERHSRFPVTTLQILAAMNNRQLPTENVEVKIATPITSSIAEPMLEIQTISLVTPHTAQIKMACRNHTECLPFYASASWPDDTASPSIPTPASKGKGSLQPVAQAVVAKPDMEKSEAAKGETSKPDGRQMIHAGSSAMLLMDKDRIHIRVRVICLESGAVGDKVRVTTSDHKQSYVAEIVNPTLLKGSL